MSSTPDDASRRRMRDAYKHAQREARAALIPIDAAQLESLVSFVDARVRADGCDYSIRYTKTWAGDHDVDSVALSAGLAELGGHCDCEVVLNCGPEEVFGR